MIAFFFLLIGLFHLFFPYASWYMSIGWRLRDAEPSEAYLILSRVGGGIVTGITMIVIIVKIVHASTVQAQTNDEWNRFKQQMTVANIRTIEDQYTNTSASRSEIKQFVQDISSVSNADTYDAGQSNMFSAAGSFVVTCRDGYVASIINIDDLGSFGMTKGSAWLAPDYEFHSNSLVAWTQDMESRSP